MGQATFLLFFWEGRDVVGWTLSRAWLQRLLAGPESRRAVADARRQGGEVMVSHRPIDPLRAKNFRARSSNNTSYLGNLLANEEELFFNSVAVTPPVHKSFALIHFNK